MDLAERNRLIAVTKGFQCLQGGLCYAPLGILNLVAGVVHLESWPQGPARDWASLALLLCAIAACVPARLYYRRRFGVVRSKRRGGPYAWLLIVGGIGGLAAFFAAAYVDGALAIQPVASYPVSLVCLFWALFYLACYLHPYRLRPHSLWFAALFFGLCFLTMVGVVPKSQFFEGSGRAGDILIWLAFSLHGLLDHLLLLRLLPKASTEPATSQSTSQSVARYD